MITQTEKPTYEQVINRLSEILNTRTNSESVVEFKHLIIYLRDEFKTGVSVEFLKSFMPRENHAEQMRTSKKIEYLLEQAGFKVLIEQRYINRYEENRRANTQDTDWQRLFKVFCSNDFHIIN